MRPPTSPSPTRHCFEPTPTQRIRRLILSRWALLAPWWARWLANAAVTAVLSTAFAALFFPGFSSTAAWQWHAAAMIGAGLAVSAALAYAQQPLRDSYTTLLSGLTHSQQEAAITAVRRGQIPADPVVHAAAIRAGAVSVASCAAAPSSKRRRNG